MDSQVSDRDERSQEFVHFFRQNERNLYAYILSLIPDAAAADEITQDTSLRLWEQFDQFDKSKDFGAWARTIAYYQVLKYRKTLSRERLQFDSEMLGMLADRASVRCDDLAIRQNYLLNCLAKLSAFKRQVIRLYYSSGMTAKAVAHRLSRDVSSVEKALVRARNDLRECVELTVRQERRS
jgi:RNA polymerase sigma-70 factor, ECF subfamily